MTAAEDRYKHWLKSAEGMNSTTRTRAFFKDLFFLKERPENRNVDIPLPVQAYRDLNDSLHNIDAKLSTVQQEQSGFIQSIRNMFSGFVGDHDRRKKK